MFWTSRRRMENIRTRERRTTDDLMQFWFDLSETVLRKRIDLSLKDSSKKNIRRSAVRRWP